MFVVKGFMELVKALGKFSVIASIAFLLIWLKLDSLFALGNSSVMNSIAQAMNILAWSFLTISATLLVIAAIDVPFQLFQHKKNMKMTKQEVKDEQKETDGRPEVKSQIRKVQQEMSRKRMMQDVPMADVVILNPTHYAVAIRYKQDRDYAPIVVAKGADAIAANIRDVAEENHVPLLTAPPLARSLYHSTDINQEIPAGLFVAVAQVLAYVYQLKRYVKGKAKKPGDLKDLPIPDDLRK